jgi:hypothetical protein
MNEKSSETPLSRKRIKAKLRAITKQWQKEHKEDDLEVMRFVAGMLEAVGLSDDAVDRVLVEVRRALELRNRSAINLIADIVENQGIEGLCRFVERHGSRDTLLGVLGRATIGLHLGRMLHQ